MLRNVYRETFSRKESAEAIILSLYKRKYQIKYTLRQLLRGFFRFLSVLKSVCPKLSLFAEGLRDQHNPVKDFDGQILGNLCPE